MTSLGYSTTQVSMYICIVASKLYTDEKRVHALFLQSTSNNFFVFFLFFWLVCFLFLLFISLLCSCDCFSNKHGFWEGKSNSYIFGVCVNLPLFVINYKTMHEKLVFIGNSSKIFPAC